jgi:hypothetical protein
MAARSIWVEESSDGDAMGAATRVALATRGRGGSGAKISFFTQVRTSFRSNYKWRCIDLFNTLVS